MDWKLIKANPDTERFHLNKILQEIRSAIDAAPTASGGYNFISSDGSPYTTEDGSDLFIGE